MRASEKVGDIDVVPGFMVVSNLHNQSYGWVKLVWTIDQNSLDVFSLSAACKVWFSRASRIHPSQGHTWHIFYNSGPKILSIHSCRCKTSAFIEFHFQYFKACLFCMSYPIPPFFPPSAPIFSCTVFFARGGKTLFSAKWNPHYKTNPAENCCWHFTSISHWLFSLEGPYALFGL